MAKFLATRRGGVLVPMDEDGEAYIAKIKEGDLVEIDVVKRRHLEFFRVYWVLIGIVQKNSNETIWPTKEDMSDSVKVTAGLRRSIFLPDGNVIYTPGSIAWHNMDELVFAAFFDRVCDVIARDFLPGVTSDELYHEVSLIIGAAFMPQRMAA